MKRICLLVLFACGCASSDRPPSAREIEREVELGADVASEVEDVVGLYDHEGLAAYVDSVGQALAAKSPRAGLKWTFRVLDTSSPNAFAVPGGHIYVTRGLLTVMETEAELASVLAHEIGHVVARHGVKAAKRRANKSARVQDVLDGIPGAGKLARVAAMREMQHRREAEREADTLSIKYLRAAGYDPTAGALLMDVLSRLEDDDEGDGEKTAAWRDTHPPLEERAAKLRELGSQRGKTGRDAYLDHLQGVRFGPDSRDGFFMGRLFVHVDEQFRIWLPSDFDAIASGPDVLARSEDEDAFAVLFTADEKSIDAARGAFFRETGFTRGEKWVHQPGYPGMAYGIRIGNNDASIDGMVAFVQHAGQIHVFLMLSSGEDWRRKYGRIAMKSLASFRPITEQWLLDVQPMRVEITRIEQATPVETFSAKNGSAVEPGVLGFLNRVDEQGNLRPGPIKNIVGFNPRIAYAQALKRRKGAKAPEPPAAVAPGPAAAVPTTVDPDAAPSAPAAVVVPAKAPDPAATPNEPAAAKPKPAKPASTADPFGPQGH